MTTEQQGEQLMIGLGNQERDVVAAALQLYADAMSNASDTLASAKASALARAFRNRATAASRMGFQIETS